MSTRCNPFNSYERSITTFISFFFSATFLLFASPLDDLLGACSMTFFVNNSHCEISHKQNFFWSILFVFYVRFYVRSIIHSSINSCIKCSSIFPNEIQEMASFELCLWLRRLTNINQRVLPTLMSFIHLFCLRLCRLSNGGKKNVQEKRRKMFNLELLCIMIVTIVFYKMLLILSDALWLKCKCTKILFFFYLSIWFFFLFLLFVLYFFFIYEHLGHLRGKEKSLKGRDKL